MVAWRFRICLCSALRMSRWLNHWRWKFNVIRHFRVNRETILNGPVWTKCPVIFFSRSTIRLMPCERRLRKHYLLEPPLMVPRRRFAAFSCSGRKGRPFFFSPWHNRAIYTRKNKTRLKKDANFPYKRHISSKIRRGLAKTRLIR